ncbi:MAG: NADH-quinone oxidoreductase subunit M [Candidatus Aminicenantales bacterium]
MSQPILSLVIFLPLAAALLMIFLPKDNKNLLYGFALAVTVVTFALSLFLFFGFDVRTGGPQFVEQAAWLGDGLQYHVGIDGISLFLVLLTTFLMPLALMSSWSSIRDKIKEYLVFMLVLETGIIGVFAALNLFLFYVFWEAMLIPMYFLIGVWGGKRRVYATTKFILFTMLGSLLMLVAIFALYSHFHEATGAYSLNLFDLYKVPIDPKVQSWLFLAFALAFAIKVPIFPFHTWLPDAHVEAPTAGSVFLAAVLLKMGAYGFLRFAIPLFPNAVEKFLPILAVLSIIGIIYGGLMALVQKDIKSLVAYSSVSHMGLIMLALLSLNVEGTVGSVFQMLNHGLSTGALFLIVGILYERAHSRQIKDFGGVSRPMPVLSVFFLIAMLSSMGLPGLNGFVGEITCFFGIFTANKVYAVLGLTTVILTAAYLLWMFQRVMQGPVANERISSFRDMNKREITYLIPIIILMFWMGLYPQTFIRKIEPSVVQYISLIKNDRRVIVHKAAGLPVKWGLRQKDNKAR